MSYSSYGILALLVYLIIDRDVLFARVEQSDQPVQRAYRYFLLSVMCYIATDILWGFIDQLGAVRLLYADTVIYYIAMASSVFLWTRYVISYLDEGHGFEVALRWAGSIYFAAVMIILTINLFWPICFWIDAQGTYHAALMRHVMFAVQVFLFLLTALYTLVLVRKSGVQARRERAIGLFGLAMGILVMAQYAYPLLPLYSAGCLLGGCVLHSFVAQDEREEHLRNVEQMLVREREHKEELERAMRLANTDALTGLGSKRAFAGVEERLEHGIEEGTCNEFGMAVLDLNGLKRVNDTLGHEAGDAFIREACRHICECFPQRPVYRIGGDEFVVMLEGDDYDTYRELAEAFDRRMEQHLGTEKPVVALGLAVFDPQIDTNYHTVFARADRLMYQRKQALKQMGAHERTT